jgi:clan AA aspartic protease
MMGAVDDAGRALVSIRLRRPTAADVTEVAAWVDTGFNGELVVPQSLATQLGLPPGMAVRATLADGSEVVLDTFACQLEWFGVWLDIEMIVNAGQTLLLGVGLLRGHVLHVDYRANSLTLD